MARYSIDEKILTDMADGIRAVIGKEEGVPGFEEAIYYVEGETDDYSYVITCQTPEAKKVLVKDISITSDECDELYFKVGYCNDGVYSSISPYIEYRVGSEYIPNEIMLNATDMYLRIGASSRNIKTKIKISATVIALDADGNVLVNKEVVVPYSMTPEQMVDEINGLGNLPIVPDEAFVLTGNCDRRFENGGMDWLINSYGDRMSSENITNVQYMFQKSNVASIPFDLNFKSNATIDFNCMFWYASNLKEVPKFNGKPRVEDMGNFLGDCYSLKHLPDDIEDWFDWSYIDNATGEYYGGSRNGGMFQNCYNLRSIPMGFLNHMNPYKKSYMNIMYYRLFIANMMLDNIIGLPIPRASDMKHTSNIFSNTFGACHRLADMTFATNEDGSPIQVNWKSQTIDLSSYVGYFSGTSTISAYILPYNPDFDWRSKWVKDDATYQVLKNDPDWLTTEIAYSRYNHDSAVRTINSLPDTTISGGTNTIKFNGASGSLTDGGAINTLTEEEIAVATAKGWTVSLT